MPKLSANLSMLFTEVPFMERFDAAAKAGFKGVECQFPYAFDMEQIAERLKSNQLEMVLFNLPAGDWEGGDRGIAANPNRVSEFRDGVEKAIEAGKTLGVKQINCLGGIAPHGVPEARIYKTFVDNLAFAAGELKNAGIRLLVEPVNNLDVPGAYLSYTQKAIDMIRDAGSDNVFLQLDIYHMQRMEGELANTIKANIAMIRHMQLADSPGRHEPGTGEINYRFLFSFIDELGYDGWIGCEYRPKTTTTEGLGWIKAHGV
ncbi:hydroxypyruvate isomerase [Oxalobacter vibrioformis]|uniref:Hydroxypyruvate isomerase n=1 Tax=Oxalobacter vibrioformis TaxID=933080 RepID=A0A9E9M1S4_9BURK|nr:hydroxypyruvate isomerase [Oxalobacter vibrioformis]WAW11208.1 hydroxypyruvate isomerase [Oxalobacter vibrioformis]